MLCRPFSREEVKQALFSIPKDKALGPDGFSSGFFKAAWPTIGEDFTTAVLDFFKSGKILGQINATNITLVPKVKWPSSVSDYRPISCCNISYKVISKLIAQRLNIVLPILISENQSAFARDRSIMTNILICQDIVKNYHRPVGMSRCLMKIDLKEAYDTVDWSFLLAVLEAMNFPRQFVSWIETCLKSAKFSVVINGQPCDYFEAKRGLRQGDPISPYLFVLVMEVFTRQMLELEENENFKYHPKCKQLKITHLVFADDVMLVCKADRTSPIEMMKVFTRFFAVSGLEINTMKRSMFFGNVKQDDKQFLLESLGFSEGSLPVRYLGLPLKSGKLSFDDCKVVIDRVQQKIDKWSSKCLSYTGRVQLVNVVLFHLQVYWCGAFLLPSKVQKAIDAATSNFIWSGQWDGEVMHLVVRDEICVPKKEGGLGVKQAKLWNFAALSKYVWQICS